MPKRFALVQFNFTKVDPGDAVAALLLHGRGGISELGLDRETNSNYHGFFLTIPRDHILLIMGTKEELKSEIEQFYREFKTNTRYPWEGFCATGTIKPSFTPPALRKAVPQLAVMGARLVAQDTDIVPGDITLILVAIWPSNTLPTPADGWEQISLGGCIRTDALHELVTKAVDDFVPHYIQPGLIL